jgi:signal peptidase I
MSPFIKNGDVLVISPVKETKLHLGDVVLCSQSGNREVVVHRIIGRADGGYITKGDNCFTSDGVSQEPDVHGLVTRVEREGTAKSLGLGPERRLIALLSRFNLFLHVVVPLWMLVRTLPLRRTP